MNLSSESMSVGFLVVIYFLASAVVALTLVYFSRPRPQNQATKNDGQVKKPESSKTGTLPGTIKPNLVTRIQQLFKSKNPAGNSIPAAKKEDISGEANSLPEMSSQQDQEANQKDGLSSKNNTGQENQLLNNIDSPQNQSPATSDSEQATSSVMATPAVVLKSEGKIVPSSPSKTEKSVENEASLPGAPVNEPIAKSESASGKPVKPETFVQKAATIPITGESTPKDQLQPDLAKPPLTGINLPEKANQVEPTTETKMEKDPPPGTPSLKIVNEKAGKNEMEVKPKENKTSNDNFSDLFTGNDDEENEISRLAKELNEVEAADILDESLNLIKEFRKSKG